MRKPRKLAIISTSANRRSGEQFGAVRAAFLLTLLANAFVGCQSASTSLPPVNLSEPGWTIRQGQAVWRPNRGPLEIAGELLVATRSDGCSVVQFTKTPLPFLVARLA